MQRPPASPFAIVSLLAALAAAAWAAPTEPLRFASVAALRAAVAVDSSLVGRKVFVEALLVESGRVVRAGDLADLVVAAPGAQRVDLGPGVAVPGLQDAHGHVESLGKALETVDLRGCASYDQLIERVAAQAERQPAGTWVEGRGWTFNIDAVRVPYKPTSGYARAGIVFVAFVGRLWLPKKKTEIGKRRRSQIWSCLQAREGNTSLNIRKVTN